MRVCACICVSVCPAAVRNWKQKAGTGATTLQGIADTYTKSAGGEGGEAPRDGPLVEEEEGEEEEEEAGEGEGTRQATPPLE